MQTILVEVMPPKIASTLLTLGKTIETAQTAAQKHPVQRMLNVVEKSSLPVIMKQSEFRKGMQLNTMFEAIVESTKMLAMTISQSVFHFDVGGSRERMISGVLFRVEKQPAMDIKIQRTKTRMMDRLIIFISLYFTGFTSSLQTGSTLHWLVKAKRVMPTPLKNWAEQQTLVTLRQSP